MIQKCKPLCGGLPKAKNLNKANHTTKAVITYQKLPQEHPSGCLDSVCIYKYLNCPVYPGGRRPVIGERYDYNG